MILDHAIFDDVKTIYVNLTNPVCDCSIDNKKTLHRDSDAKS